MTDSNMPVMEFKNEEELQQSLEEWQERLFLSDWNIAASLVNGEEIAGLAGDSTVQWTNSCGTIRIRHFAEMPNGAIEKEPHEKVLVHELLHFKIMGYTNSNAGIEEVFFDESQHRLLEQLAKSLIMAKYNIGYDWFKQ